MSDEYYTDETVVIPKELYEELLADSKLLDKLYIAGVDNWEGYKLALEDDE